MHKLDQLREMTEVVADTGDLDAIASFRPVDATTNPSLLLKAAQSERYAPLIEEALNWIGSLELHGEEKMTALTDYLAVAAGREILQLIPGRVSTEVDARLSFDTEATVQRARRLIAIYEDFGIPRTRVLIKIASTWEGIRAAETLQKEEIDCNLTLIFSPVQALAAADAGAFLISPFVGRIYDWYCRHLGVDYIAPAEDPGVASVSTIYQMFKKRGYPTLVMGASFRTMGQVEALAGCDRLTIAPALLQQLGEDSGNLKRQLNPTMDEKTPDLSCVSESDFRLQLNADPMATEKLAEGIRLFIQDQIKLEELLQEKLD